MLAYCLSLWGFVCKYIWLQMQPFITIHPATAGAIAREVAQWRFASQTSVLLAPALFVFEPLHCVPSCMIVCTQGLAILTINHSLEFYKEIIHGTQAEDRSPSCHFPFMIPV